jgi:GDP-4-dehydro-6-deoxy-D-mannose reductase
MLLIGARGFVGGHLSRLGKAAGLRVVGASRHPGSDLTCDLADLESIRRVVRDVKPEFVANMAGEAILATGWKDPAATLQTNAIGVANLLEAVAAENPGAHVLCVSSSQVYGPLSNQDVPVGEEHALDPRNPYAASKVAMEMICRAHVQAGDLQVAVMRAFNKIGPGQPEALAASGFARRIAEAEHGGERSVGLAVGNLAVARDFTDVRDVARAYLLVLRHRVTGTFNCCSGHPVKLKELIEHMQNHTKLPIHVRQAAELTRPNDPPVIAGSNARLRETTGWKPEIALDQTLTDLLDWWRGCLTKEGV